MTDAINVLATHAAHTLPDSIDGRKRVLRAIQKVLTDRHPAMLDVRAQLATLETITDQQSALPLKFSG